MGKNFLAINFLKQESWARRAETGERENFAFGMPMEDLHLFYFMPINIGKLTFVDFVKESITVSVKFTFETSIIEMPTMFIVVSQHAKIGK